MLHFSSSSRATLSSRPSKLGSSPFFSRPTSASSSHSQQHERIGAKFSVHSIPRKISSSSLRAAASFDDNASASPPHDRTHSTLETSTSSPSALQSSSSNSSGSQTQRKPQSSSGSTPPPVLILPGFLTSASLYEGMKKNLEDIGFSQARAVAQNPGTLR